MTKYANRCDYTDVHPFEVVAVPTAKKMMVRAMEAERDPSWKMDFHPGGFFGHVANQRSQRWFFKSLPDAPVFAIRQHKDGRWYDSHGSRYAPADEPRRFHDYNF